MCTLPSMNHPPTAGGRGRLCSFLRLSCPWQLRRHRPMLLLRTSPGSSVFPLPLPPFFIRFMSGGTLGHDVPVPGTSSFPISVSILFRLSLVPMAPRYWRPRSAVSGSSKVPAKDAGMAGHESRYRAGLRNVDGSEGCRCDGPEGKRLK